MPPPTEQTGARLNAPPNGVEAIVAPLPPEPSPEDSAAQSTDIELTANRNTHTARRPTGSQQSRNPPIEQPGARINAPPSGVEAIVAPFPLLPPPKESAAQSQELEFAALRSARTLRRPTSLQLTPEPPSGEIANVPPPAPLETGSIRYAVAAESYGKLPPPLAEREELNSPPVDTVLGRLFAEHPSGKMQLMPSIATTNPIQYDHRGSQSMPAEAKYT
ncbi:zyxin-like [Drosophila rhopaloa]|uniref:Uncharacterized protein n=1 Tax=Drosophila rhopaloa TaxID=1041015 RepID=A0ABM5J0Z5_DRORH|nr:zyxin-like [Drosophila rhopaloa]